MVASARAHIRHDREDRLIARKQHSWLLDVRRFQYHRVPEPWLPPQLGGDAIDQPFQPPDEINHIARLSVIPSVLHVMPLHTCRSICRPTCSPSATSRRHRSR